MLTDSLCKTRQPNSSTLRGSGMPSIAIHKHDDFSQQYNVNQVIPSRFVNNNTRQLHETQRC